MSTDETDPVKRLMALTMSTEKETPAELEGCAHAASGQEDKTKTICHEENEKQAIDWEVIELEYSTGLRSGNAIARDHGVHPSTLHERVKRYGWTRQLADKVRRRAEHELLFGKNDGKGAVSPDGQADDPHAQEAATVEAAAKSQVKIVRTHRKDIEQLRTLQGRLVEKAAHFFGKEKGSKGTAITSLADLQTAVQTVESLARTVSKVIPLERQAYNLEGERGPNSEVNAIEQRVKRYQEAKRADRDNPQAVAQAVKAAQERGENILSLEARVAQHNETDPDVGA